MSQPIGGLERSRYVRVVWRWGRRGRARAFRASGYLVHAFARERRVRRSAVLSNRSVTPAPRRRESAKRHSHAGHRSVQGGGGQVGGNVRGDLGGQWTRAIRHRLAGTAPGELTPDPGDCKETAFSD